KRGKTVTDWQPTEQALTTRYRNKDFSRAFRVMAKNPGSPMSLANGKLQFAIELEPGEKWHSCLLYDFADGDTWSKAPLLCVAEYQASDAAKKQKSWRASVVKVEASDTGFARAFSQALDDMSALRLPIEDTDQIKFV